MICFHDLLTKLGLFGGDNTLIQGVSENHKEIQEGWLFLARYGKHVHGAKFIDSVLKYGGIVLCERKGLDGNLKYSSSKVVYCDSIDEIENLVLLIVYGKVWEKVTMVGVSGTNGKTSVTNFISQLWGMNHLPYLWIGTDGVCWNGKFEDNERTTPFANKLFSLLDQAIRQGIQYVVMEISSHAIMQGRISLLRFDTILLNPITSDHMDFHLTETQYRYTKFSLRWYLKEHGKMIIYQDQEEMKELYQFINTKLLTVGRKDAHFYISNCKVSQKGSVFYVNDYRFQSSLIGNFQINNLAMVIAYGRSIGLPYQVLQNQISLLKGKAGRLEVMYTKEQLILIDYAHTASALKSVLIVANEIKKEHQRVVLLFGCGGERDQLKRKQMGKIACAYSDEVIVTTDNPRREKAWKIIQDIIDFKEFHGKVIENRQFAIKHVLTNAKKDDIILICGRGAEKWQLVGDELLPYCDKETIIRVLEGGFPCF